MSRRQDSGQRANTSKGGRFAEERAAEAAGCSAVDGRAEEIISVSDCMFRHPELGYKEKPAK